MWRQQQPSVPMESSPVRGSSESTETVVTEPVPARPRVQAVAADQSSLSRGIVLEGEVSGTGALFLDGVLHGSVCLPGDRVTIGPNGRVEGKSGRVCIQAREAVVFGKVSGDIDAHERVEIRASGSVVGDIHAARISIEDGAYVQGAIDVRKSNAIATGEATSTLSHA